MRFALQRIYNHMLEPLFGPPDPHPSLIYNVLRNGHMRRSGWTTSNYAFRVGEPCATDLRTL